MLNITDSKYRMFGKFLSKATENLKVFLWSIIFSKKALFSEETAKNHSGEAFENFLGERGFLGKKLI